MPVDSSTWRPTKYLMRDGKLNAGLVRPASRLMANLVAEYYTTAIPRYARGALLDLGCGEAPLYAAYGACAGSVTTSDWHDGPHVDVVSDLTAELSFEDGRFDTVILSDVLEHLPNPSVVMGEVARILAPGGTLLLNVPFLYTIHEAPHDYHRYTEFALTRMVEEAGLTLVELDRLGGLPEVLVDLVSKGVSAAPVVGPAIAGVLQRLGWSWHRSGLGRRFARKTTAYTPSGYALAATKD